MNRNNKKQLKLVSLFTGAMGLDLGLEQAGFKTLVANEIDSAAVKTIRHNRPDLPVISDSIVDIGRQHLEDAAGESLLNIDLVAGGPPCQAFSVYGNRNGIADERGTMIYEFIRVIEELKPKCFVMENVRGLHSMPIVPAKFADKANTPKWKTEHGSLLREILKNFNALGYRVDCYLVNVVNYGGPQIRERLICIGNRLNRYAEFPKPLYSNRPEDGLPPFVTLGDAIGGTFKDNDTTLMNFSPRKLKYLAMVPSGGNWRSLPVDIQKESMGKSWYLKGGRSATWRKLSFDFPSPTVVTMPNHASTSMCHPTELRALTAGECAAIQEFPNDWEFQGSPVERYRQIGNAVPVRLGHVAGETVTDVLEGKTDMSDEQYRIIHLRPHVRTRTFFKNGTAYAGTQSYYARKPDNEDTLFD